MSQQTLSKLDLSHINEISSSRQEPDWLRQYRSESLAVYNDLPLEVSPLYNKYTDAKRLNLDKVYLGINTDSTIPPFLDQRMKELENSNHIVQIGTNIVRSKLDPSLKDKGVVISSLSDAISTKPDLLQTILNSEDSSEDKFTALNNAAFNTGIFIHIPKNIKVDESIFIQSCMSSDELSSISKNVINVDESSSVRIVQELYSPTNTVQQSYLEMLDVNVGAAAKLDLTTLQMMDKSSVNFSTRHTRVHKDGIVNWYLGLFGSILSRYRINYHLIEPGANVNDSEVIFGDGKQSFDMQTVVNHSSHHTEGRVIEKSILRNKSRSLFKGMIRINENAAKSNSYLSGRSILLDSEAKSDSIPGLEILTNDVKATHSASVAQIDEEQIFYLATRCLDKATAEKTIIEGFLEPLSRKMSYQVRAWIAYLIESKWEGKELLINDDEELRKFTEVEETRYDEDTEIEQHYKYR